MKYLGSVILLLAVVFFAGCDSETEVTEDTTLQQLFPLKTGNFWVWHGSEFDEYGAIDEDYFDTISVGSAMTLGGLSGFVIRTPEDSIFLAYSGSNLISHEVDDFDQTIILRYPMNLNEDFVLRDTTYDGGYRSRETMRLVSKNVSVTVDAGTFTAFKYVNTSMAIENGDTDTTSIEELFFAPNIGLVKIDNYRYIYPDTTTLRLRSRTQLSSYSVK